MTWLQVTRYYHLCCEDLGIRTVGDLVDAPTDQLDVLCLNGERDARELRAAINALAARHPEPFDVDAAQSAEITVELARMK